LSNLVEEESRLMTLAQHDPLAFEPLYERYVDRVYRYCLRRLGNAHEAEDLTSQVFTRALTALHTYRGGMVSAWLFQIAANVVIDHVRQRRPQLSLDTIDLTAPAESPIEQIVQAEEIALLHQLLGTIPTEQRELLDLKLNTGLNSQEIGQQVGKSATAVRSILHRALRRLHDLYQAAESKNTMPSESEEHPHA
jgi:RNA polymerase sigma-70 factor (ECF subfamily)